MHFCLLFVGCSDSTNEDSSGQIVKPQPEQIHGNLDVWSWNIAAESLKGLTPAYQAGHPHVKVHVDMTGADMTMRFMLSLAAGTGAPDVSQLQMIDVPHYIATGCLADLTQVAAKYKDSFPSSLWDTCAPHGHVYAIPWDMGPCAVFYKRNIFAKYRVDPEKIDTWDDYVAAGRKILAQSGGRTKMMTLSSADLARVFLILFAADRRTGF